MVCDIDVGEGIFCPVVDPFDVLPVLFEELIPIRANAAVAGSTAGGGAAVLVLVELVDADIFKEVPLDNIVGFGPACVWAWTVCGC